jgi:hypothetical protein
MGELEVVAERKKALPDVKNKTDSSLVSVKSAPDSADADKIFIRKEDAPVDQEEKPDPEEEELEAQSASHQEEEKQHKQLIQQE